MDIVSVTSRVQIYTLKTFLKVLNTNKIPLQDLTKISRLFCLILFKFNYSYTMKRSKAKKNKDHKISFVV